MHTSIKLSIAAVVIAASTAGAQGARAAAPARTDGAMKKDGYKKDLPDSLVREAKITEAAAAATAQARIPKGRLASVELERESGKLLYSYDIKVPGKSGIDEVQVDAMTGTLFGGVAHEGAATEKKEAADEAREKKAATTRKPPMI